MSIANQSLKNSAFSFLGYTLPIVFAILVTPILVLKLGNSEYGIFILANTIMGFLNLVDLGVGQAILKYLSEKKENQPSEEQEKIFQSGNFMFWAIGIFGLLVFVILGSFFLPLFKIQTTSFANIRIVFFLTGVVFLINSLTVVQGSALKAIQRYDITVKISLFYIFCFNCLALVMVFMGQQLKAVVLMNVLSASLSLCLHFFAVKKYYPNTRIILPKFFPERIKSLYSFGFKVFITNIANNTLAQFDRLLIPAFFGTTQLTFYTIPGSVAEKINGVSGTSTSFLFPLLSSISSDNEQEKQRIIYQKVIKSALVFVFALTTVACLFSSKILTYWMGAIYAEKGTVILIILSITSAILGVYSIMQNMLLGMNKIKFLMLVSLFMAALNLIFLFILLPKYNILGAAWAYLVSVLPVFWAIFYAERKYFNIHNQLHTYSEMFFKLTFVLLVVYGIYVFLIQHLVFNLITLMVFGGLTFLLFIGLFVLFDFLPKEDMDIYKNFIREKLGKNEIQI